MCPPGHASSRDPFTGRHTGRPLRIRLKYQSTPKQRAGTEPRPYRSIAVPNGGPMWSSAPTKRRESRRDHPGQRRTAERLRQRSQGVGLGCSRGHPRSVQQPRTIPQSRPLADSSCCGAQNSLLADRSQNFDRSHSLTSQHLPPAALGSLPLYTREPLALRGRGKGRTCGPPLLIPPARAAPAAPGQSPGIPYR